MLRAASILFWVMGFCLVASAQNANFELQLVNDSKIILAPGVTTNLAIRLVNNMNEDKLVSLKINLPKGWRCFSDLNTIHTLNSQSVIKVLSINIPSITTAGNFFIPIIACDKFGRNIAEIKLPVTIESKYALSIELINDHGFVFAGDSLSVQFIIQNLSNSKTKIDGLFIGNCTDRKISFALNPDSSILITRNVITEKGILNSVQKNITLTVSVAGNPDLTATKSYSYMIIPGLDVKFDPYNNLPIKFSTMFLTDNSRGKRDYAIVADIQGSGFLDDFNKKELSFHLRGPDRRGNPLYGIYDEYFMEYITPKSKFFLGDQTYRLSYLTEYARYSRGAQVEHSFNHFTIGSFMISPRFYPGIKQEESIYLSYYFPSKFILNIGYLNKLKSSGEVNNLYTLSSIITPMKWLKFDGEYAIGTVGTGYKKAYKTEIKINLKSVQLYYNYMIAEKDFPGYFNDSRYMEANGSINLSPKININASYNFDLENKTLDTLYSNAPFNKNLSIALNYGFIKDGGFSLSYNYCERQDQMKPQQFNYNENSAMLSFNKRIGKFRTYIRGEYGTFDNLLLPPTKRINKLFRSNFNLNFKASNKLSINGFVNYQQSNLYLTNNYKNWVYGGSVNGSINKKISLLLNFQSSYEITEYYLNRSLIDACVAYSPDKNNKIELSGRYDLTKNSLYVKELFIMAKFIHTFNVPVGKKKNLGKLSGQVINKGVKTIEGIVFSIGSDQAVTDKNGNYYFPMLPAGNYYLMIDYSKAGVFAVPETPGPYPIEILPGRESRFDIALTLAAKITGAVSILKDISDEDKSYAGIRDRLGKLLVEAKNGGEVYRIFTKDDGQFAFESLRPGAWTVRVYEAGIPNEYQLVTDQFNVGLSSGKEEHLEVKIKEVRRRIKFQKSIDITPDFETTKPAVPGSKKTDSSNKNNKPVKTAKRVVKTPEKITRIDTAQVKKQIRVVSLKGKESKSTSQNLEYRIQVGSYDKPLVSTDKLAAKLNITEKIEEDLFNGHYIYTIGSFKSQREAAIRNKEIQKNASTSGSFIVSFRDGTRTTKLEKPELAEK